MAIAELPDGRQVEVDPGNPEHMAWLEQAAKAALPSPGKQAALSAGRGAASLPKALAAAPTVPPGSLPLAGLQALSRIAAPDLEKMFPKQPATLGNKLAEGAGAGAIFGPAGAMGGAVGGVAEQAVRSAGAPEGLAITAGIATPMLGGLAVDKLGNIARNIAQGATQGGREQIAGRLLNRVTGDNRDALIQALKNPRQTVPGEKVTTGMVGADMNIPAIPAMEQGLRNFDPQGWHALDEVNRMARGAQIGQIAQTPEALAQAIAKRGGDASNLYGAAFANKLNLTPAQARTLRDILSDPFVRKATPTAEALSQSLGRTTPIGELHTLKQSLDDLLSHSRTSGIGPTEEAAIVRARNRLVSWIESVSPDYQKARSTFAAQSGPINQMQTGQYLQGKLTSPLDDSTERAGVFAQALRDAPGTIKRSTGRGFDNLDEVLTPGQVQSTQNVQESLARILATKQQAKAGAGFVQREIGDALFPPVEPRGVLDRTVTITREIAKVLQGRAGKKTLTELSEAFRDPQKVAELLEKVPPEQRIALIKALQRGAGAGAATLPE